MSSSLHENAATGFQSQTDAYEKARPTYPEEAVDAIFRDLLQFPSNSSQVVLEFGAGTGKFTRKLLSKATELSSSSSSSNSFRVIAVEPVEGMRRKFQEIFPNAVSIEKGSDPSTIDGQLLLIDGTADAAGDLPSNIADGILAAQAFHWFANIEALKEFHRLLRPGGHLILIWNSFQEEDWAKEARQFFMKYNDGSPQYSSGKWREVFDSSEAKELFELPLQSRFFTNFQEQVDSDTLWLRFESISFIAKQTKERRAEIRKELEEFLRKRKPEIFEEGGLALFDRSCKTELVFCRRK